MHQSNIHKYKSSELLVCTILYTCIYTPLWNRCLLRYTVGLVSFTPYKKGEHVQSWTVAMSKVKASINSRLFMLLEGRGGSLL
jgi:hypothetical protein